MLALLVAVVALLPTPARADVATDPPLSVDPTAVEAALDCHAGDGGGEVVLLVPGTFTPGPVQYDRSWGPALAARGLSWCTVTPPDLSLGDVQVSAEYVVHAIRVLADRSDGPVDVVGHSQGGLLARWAVRFWPRTRALVDDVVAVAAPLHGTDVDGLLARQDVLPLGVAPAFALQLRPRSRLLAALATDETPDGVDSTQLWSTTDEVVVPATPTATAALDQGREGPDTTNLAVQDRCPGRIVSHTQLGTSDRLTFELVAAALTTPGPLDPAGVDVDCGDPTSLPTIGDPAPRPGFPSDLHLVRREPPLADYAAVVLDEAPAATPPAAPTPTEPPTPTATRTPTPTPTVVPDASPAAAPPAGDAWVGGAVLTVAVTTAVAAAVALWLSRRHAR